MLAVLLKIEIEIGCTPVANSEQMMNDDLDSAAIWWEEDEDVRRCILEPFAHDNFFKSQMDESDYYAELIKTIQLSIKSIHLLIEKMKLFKCAEEIDNEKKYQFLCRIYNDMGMTVQELDKMTSVRWLKYKNRLICKTFYRGLLEEFTASISKPEKHLEKLNENKKYRLRYELKFNKQLYIFCADRFRDMCKDYLLKVCDDTRNDVKNIQSFFEIVNTQTTILDWLRGFLQGLRGN